jgi:hypothetical protein
MKVHRQAGIIPGMPNAPELLLFMVDALTYSA